MKSERRISSIEWEKTVLKELGKLEAKTASFFIEEVELVWRSTPTVLVKRKPLLGNERAFVDYGLITTALSTRFLSTGC